MSENAWNVLKHVHFLYVDWGKKCYKKNLDQFIFLTVSPLCCFGFVARVQILTLIQTSNFAFRFELRGSREVLVSGSELGSCFFYVNEMLGQFFFAD